MKSFRLESAFAKWLREQLREAGAEIFTVVGNFMQRSGWPDIYVCSVAWRGWIELKVDDHKLEALQRATILKMRLRGDNVFVLRHLSKKGTFILEGPDGETEGELKGTGQQMLRQLALFESTRRG